MADLDLAELRRLAAALSRVGPTEVADLAQALRSHLVDPAELPARTGPPITGATGG